MIIWEDLTPAQKRAIKEMSEVSFRRMIQIWFQVVQAQKFKWNWHLSYLCNAVEEIVSGTRSDTIFNVPPGSSKTEIFSIHLPIYAMLNCDRIRSLNLSYSDQLTKDNGVRTREIISCPEFQELWPCKLARASGGDIDVLNRNNKAWLVLTSRSIGGQVTGKRGGYMDDGFSGLLMLDDPDKPSDLLSNVKREASLNRMKNTIVSRPMKGDTPIIVIQQRLHINDSTWLLTQGGLGGREFDVISIPALVTEEYGKSLPEWLQPEFERDVLSTDYVLIDGVKHWSFWPAKLSAENLVKLRDADLYTFESQYQQKPIALGGNLLKPEWYQYYGSGDNATIPTPDRFEYTFVTADTAQKAGELNDYSVICHWGIYKERVYFIDGIRGKWEAPELKIHAEAFIKDAWARNKTHGSLRHIWIEDKASGTGLIQDIGRRTPIKIEPVQRNNDKLTRCMDAAPVLKAGRVALPCNHHMLSAILSETAAFTADNSHPNDDFLDNLFDAVNMGLNMADDPVARMKALAGLKDKPSWAKKN